MSASYTFIKADSNNEIDRLMFTKFALVSSDEFVEYGDEKYFITKNYLNHIDELLNFEVYNDDVWLTSFPRSGTTWAQEMIATITTKNFTEKNLRAIFPFLEYSAMFDGERKQIVDGKLIKPEHLNNTINHTKNLQRPRLIKTHLPWQLLPKQIQTGERKPKIIHVSRNSKDVCCSYFHFYYYVSNKCRGNLNEFAQLFLNNRVMFGPFWTHIKNYRKQNYRDNILYITYEEMHRNLRTVIQNVAEFLHVKMSDDEIEKLMDNMNFQKMKNNPQLKPTQVVEGRGKGVFFRKGQVGQYETEMTPELIKVFDERDSELNDC